MSWKDEYRAAVIDLVLRTGLVMADEPSSFGWQDYDSFEHKFTAAPDSVIGEESILQFVDTLTGNEYEQVMTLSKCSCDCGRYRDVTIGRNGSVGSILREILDVVG